MLLSSYYSYIIKMNNTPPQKTLDKVSWEEFKSRKIEQLQEILARLDGRLKESHPSPQNQYNLDLDMLPVLSAWNSIPFTYTVNSASGTMREHGTHECRNNIPGEPHGFIMAYSFQRHPSFEEFRRGLSEIPGFDTALSKLGENTYYFKKPIQHDENLYMHLPRLWVPEEELNKSDSYLITKWEELIKYLAEFRGRVIKDNRFS